LTAVNGVITDNKGQNGEKPQRLQEVVKGKTVKIIDELFKDAEIINGIPKSTLNKNL
jgi:hypothetical protein